MAETNRRADLEARIKGARACLAYIESCQAKCVKRAATLQEQRPRISPITGKAKAGALQSIERAESKWATTAQAASKGRATCTALLLALQTELDELNEGVR